jgi:predicted nucleic acid-binding Zn ribbon protein
MALLIYKCEKCGKVYEFVTTCRDDVAKMLELKYKCEHCKGDIKKQITKPSGIVFL